jgi:hypothetical protein
VSPRTPRDDAAGAKARFALMLHVLSRNPSPLSIADLVVLLQEQGHRLSPLTPRKWPIRGIPAGWAMRIAELPRAQEVGLTAAWLFAGKGPEPFRPPNL